MALAGSMSILDGWQVTVEALDGHVYMDADNRGAHAVFPLDSLHAHEADEMAHILRKAARMARKQRRSLDRLEKKRG